MLIIFLSNQRVYKYFIEIVNSRFGKIKITNICSLDTFGAYLYFKNLFAPFLYIKENIRHKFYFFK